MLKGQVDFVARVLDTGITFTPIHFKPPVAGVGSATVEMRGIEELSGTVRISLVANAVDGMSLARIVIESAFNRLAFFHGLAIEPARVTGSNFSPTNPQPDNYVYPGAGYINITGYAPKVTIGVSSATIQSELEQPELPGEVNFGYIRSARLSVGPVEEFMHLYGILLIFFNDKQKNVDRFVVSIESSVQQTRVPRSTNGTLETVYTRLRNEFAHKREGTVLEITKLEMSKHLAGLRTIVQQAISQYS